MINVSQCPCDIIFIGYNFYYYKLANVKTFYLFILLSQFNIVFGV